MGKPEMPISVWLLGLVVGVGLVALFLAARAAFGTVAGKEQAVAAALLIEAGTVVEALAVARSRNRIAGAGLVISFLVSVSYNVTQVVDVRPGLEMWQILAFGVGPLSALTFISLALGEEVRLYGLRVDEWKSSQVHSRELARKREERRAYKLKELELGRTLSGQAGNGRSGVGRWPDKAAFLADPDRPAGLKAVELAAMSGRSERSARRWIQEAREGVKDGTGKRGIDL